MLQGSTEYDKIQKTNGLKTFFIGCLVILIASIVILASVPPVSRDALIHHLKELSDLGFRPHVL